MTKRYYICRRIGTGTMEDSYRSELNFYIRSNHPMVRFLKQVIVPTSEIVLASYDLTQTQHDDVVANVSQLLTMPEGSLNNELSTVPIAKRQAIQTKLENAGFDFGWATLSNTIKDVLKYLAHSMQISAWLDTVVSAQNFDINKTVGSISIPKRTALAQHMADIGVDSSWITGSTTIKEVVSRIQIDTGRLYEDSD